VATGFRRHFRKKVYETQAEASSNTWDRLCMGHEHTFGVGAGDMAEGVGFSGGCGVGGPSVAAAVWPSSRLRGRAPQMRALVRSTTDESLA
jgi:hypothetical protein